MEDLDSEIYSTKVERVIKFNKCYDALNHFVLKDNDLYRRVFKIEQPEKLVVCDYNTTEMIEKVYAQLEYAGNLKTFTKIKQLYYGINKQIVEWLLKRYTVCFNYCWSNICMFFQPIITSKVMK